jgi:hypothetical protein
MKCVYSAVRTGSLNKAVCSTSSNGYENTQALYDIQFQIQLHWTDMKQNVLLLRKIVDNAVNL